MPARIDLETVLATFKSFVTMPAANPYFVLFALCIASSVVLQNAGVKTMWMEVQVLIQTEKGSTTYLNFMSDITGPNISSLQISISSWGNETNKRIKIINITNEVILIKVGVNPLSYWSWS